MRQLEAAEAVVAAAAAAAQKLLPNLRLHGANNELRMLALLVDDLADVSQLVLHTKQLALENIDLLQLLRQRGCGGQRREGTCSRSWSAMRCTAREPALKSNACSRFHPPSQTARAAHLKQQLALNLAHQRLTHPRRSSPV